MSGYFEKSGFIQKFYELKNKSTYHIWKGDVNINTLRSFNETVKYIEDNLTKNIDKNVVKKISGYSYALFSRMFFIISGMNLDEYIRNRKLTNAAYDIVNTDKKISDIALKYGYESQNIFEDDFKKYHNFTPEQVRETKKYKVFSPIYFYLDLNRNENIEVRFERREKFKVAGLSIKTEKTEDFEKLWDELINKYDYDCLKDLGNGQVFGICYGFNSGRFYSYFAGFDFKKQYKEVEEKGLEILEIPEASYAVFTLKGSVPESIHQAWKYIIEEFFPKNRYTHAETPDFELYFPGDVKSEKYRMELWVPISKRQNQNLFVN